MKDLSLKEIMEILPHRYPFLMVDKIISWNPEKKEVVGVKNVSANEPWTQGHFPGSPIMPGVLSCEFMAQVAGIGGYLELTKEDGNINKLCVFAGMDGVKFRKPALPGDVLVCKAHLTTVNRRAIKFTANTSVNGKISAEISTGTLLITERSLSA